MSWRGCMARGYAVYMRTYDRLRKLYRRDPVALRELEAWRDKVAREIAQAEVNVIKEAEAAILKARLSAKAVYCDVLKREPTVLPKGADENQ